MKRKSRFLACLPALAAVLLWPGFANGRESYSHQNAIPPRLQWEAHGGYCGEVSLISAGLYFGQYLSQYDARVCAIGNVPQDQGELLLGVNDRRAAREMHLKSIEWNNQNQTRPAPFLRWVKRQVLLGNPVAIGVYNNEFLIYQKRYPYAGDLQYDHIVPVMRIRSHHSLRDRRYFGSDHLTFSDNGLWGDSQDHPYFFSYAFGTFPASRAAANARNGPLYSLPNYGANYGIAITGVMDADGDTLPVRVETNKNDERPAMARKSIARPPSRPLTLTITVSKLTAGASYKLYRYDRLAAVPDSHFNAHAPAAAQTWDIVARESTFSLNQEIRSDEVAVYRCVRTDAP